MNSKTLIIHPDDRSTDFLKPIYEHITNATIFVSGTKEHVYSEISKHDRVIMLGHGSPWGLFSVGQFDSGNGLIIDNSAVHLLSQKKDNIYIWCNADQFVNRHELKGFYSGMFISEVSEANFCGLPGTPQSVVDQSNNSFARWLGKVINEPLRKAYKHTKSNYKILAEGNSVAAYNNNRLFLR
jgi:hypothetical protein